MTNRRQIRPEDVLALEDYAKIRSSRRQELIEMKRNRRVAVGPLAMFYFENYDTMLQQVQEMLWIEKGGEEQLADELAAYNPLIPQGEELVATVMFEIDDEVRRQRILAELGGVEDTMSIEIDGERIRGEPETSDHVERTTAAGKTSSIHFMHFRFNAGQIERFRQHDARVIVQIEHENYAHMAVVRDAIRSALASDFS